MGHVPELPEDFPEDFPTPEGMKVVPIRVKGHEEKLEFHLALTEMEAGVAIQPHFEDPDAPNRKPTGFTVHVHGIGGDALVESLEIALHAAVHAVEAHAEHMARHRANEN